MTAFHPVVVTAEAANEYSCSARYIISINSNKPGTKKEELASQIWQRWYRQWRMEDLEEGGKKDEGNRYCAAH